MEQGIFYKPRQFFRAIISMIIAISLFVLSSTNHLDVAKRYLDSFTSRIFIFNKGANTIINNFSTNFKELDKLSTETEQLQQKVVLLQQKLTKLLSLEQENKELKELLNIRYQNLEVAKEMVVSVINVEQGYKNNIIFIDKGKKDNLYIGQNIYDRYGLIGQIISVSDNSSRVLLVTSSNSYVPVFNLSNQEQYIINGKNTKDLEVLFFNTKSSLNIGDILYTSGLGKTYIVNYPVASISHIERDSNNNILSVVAKPLSNLQSLRYMVAVWPYCQVTQVGQYNFNLMRHYKSIVNFDSFYKVPSYLKIFYLKTPPSFKSVKNREVIPNKYFQLHELYFNKEANKNNNCITVGELYEK